MRNWLKIAAVIPWWVVGRLIGLDKVEKQYDYRTLRGYLAAPLSRKGYVIGWSCWILLLAGVGLTLWRLFRLV